MVIKWRAQNEGKPSRGIWKDLVPLFAQRFPEAASTRGHDDLRDRWEWVKSRILKART